MKIALSVLVLLFLLLIFGVGYHTGYKNGRQSVRIAFRPDVSDSAQMLPPAKICDHPYFTRNNPIPGEYGKRQ